MRGSLWIEKESSPVSKLSAADVLEGLLLSAAVGLAAGLVAGHIRLHLGMPGHKALLWMVPVIVARLLTSSPAGATAGTLTAAITTLGVGGNFAGIAAHLPVATLAGVILDIAIGFVQHRGLKAHWAIPLAGLAAAGANLMLFAKRLLAPLFRQHQILGLSGLDARFLSYAGFGFAAGIIAAAIGYIILRRRTRK